MQNTTKRIVFLLFGGFFTFVLFIGMTFLVKPDIQEPLPGNKNVRYVPFNIKDKPPSLIKRELPKEIKPLERPQSERSVIARVQLRKESLITEKGLQVSMTGLKLAIASHAGFNPWGSSTGSASGLQPSIRINPTYPIPAARDNIEGFVTLSFDITELGTTENISVIEAKPRFIFNKAAVRALRKWKYSPKMEDGQPVEQGGHLITLQFQLESH